MKKKLMLLGTLLLVFQWGVAASFYDPISRLKPRNYYSFVVHRLRDLYQKGKSKREDSLKILKESLRKPIHEGDSFFIYRLLADFVMGRQAPKRIRSDKHYARRIDDLRKEALEILVDEAKDADLSISNREFVISQLARIARNDARRDFGLNEVAIDALLDLAEEDNLLVRHPALIGLRFIAVKSTEKWKELAKEAAKRLVSELESDNTELQRISFIECLTVLKKVNSGSQATKLVWEKTIDALTTLESPRLKKRIRAEWRTVINRLSGPLFAKEVREAKKALKKMVMVSKRVREPLPELLSLVKSESDPDELEPALSALLNECKKDRALLLDIHNQLISFVMAGEYSEYKMRVINDTLIEITHLAKTPLFFYQTAATFLGEVGVYRTGQKARIPLFSLGNLLSSTNYEGLILPVLLEIETHLDTDLPLWLRRRLIGLIFLQAGDSPDIKTALRSARLLARVSNTSHHLAIKWEAAKRLRYLSKYAKNTAVRRFASSWK